MNQTNNALDNDESKRNRQTKPTGGIVVSLYVASSADVPMIALLSARVVPGRGMVGDRYYLRRGTDPAYDESTCDVTLVEQETINAMKQRESSINPGESARRNIVVQNCALSQLIGRTFRIGEVTFQGLLPRNKSGASLEDAYQNTSQESAEQSVHCESLNCLELPHPDLRAAVLTEGTISVRDQIEVI
jgi:MOSC domain-containing protein YiiM